MTDNLKLKYLLDLLDDDSKEIREEILKQFSNYGYLLENDLSAYHDKLDSQKLKMLGPIIESNRKKWLDANWNTWLEYETDYEQIEAALNLISKYHYGLFLKPELPQLLDGITEEFKNKIPYGNELDLANFLFQEKEIKGAVDDYYNPFNSNPYYALKERRGIPITLCLIYILIGNRLGFNIKSSNFPGHFLARVEMEDEILFIDCFNGGKILYESDVINLAKDSYQSFLKIIYADINSRIIVRRILKNLIRAYSINNDTANIFFFQKLFDATPL
jgi:regulator of sirC expression with transglutaminase-like and TPR domain